MKTRHIAVVAVRLLSLYLIVVNLSDVLGALLLNLFRKEGLYNGLPTYSLLTFALGLILWMAAPWIARNSIQETEEEDVKIDMAQFVACAIAGIFLWVMATNVGSVVFYFVRHFYNTDNAAVLGSAYGLSRDPYSVFTSFIVSFLIVLFAPRLGIAFENTFSDVKRSNNA